VSGFSRTLRKTHGRTRSGRYQQARQDVLDGVRRLDGADLPHGRSSYLRLATHEAIVVALLIATIKGSLVALFFMHLVDERRLIYSVLVLTVVFFIFLMFVPLATILDRIVIRYQ